MTNNASRRKGAGHGVVQRLFARLDDLQPRGSRNVVAFSGGGDSTALAIGIAEARRAGRSRPWLGHVEHRVRAHAGADLPIVLATAERLELPLSIRAVAAGAIGTHRGCGIEEAMRRERYLVLARIADETESTVVLTAHHAEDQAETVLGHLIRGSGLLGAAGMRPTSSMVIPWWPSPEPPRAISVLRPMLAERRQEMLDLVAARNLAIVDDETNRHLDRTRAALRHDVIPILERIHPDATSALARFAELAREVVDRELGDPDVVSVGEDQLAIVDLMGMPRRDRRATLRSWVLKHAGIDLAFQRIEAVRHWVETEGAGHVELGEGWSIHRRGPTISLHRDEPDGRPTTR